MNDYSGEKFLDKLYSNLYMSDEVQHTKQNTDKRHEAIRRYLDRLERVHKKADTETKKQLLKSLYYDKYVIKEDILREKVRNANIYVSEEELQENIELIINAQKKSLDKWIDYLSNDTAQYPSWAKYWAFQGMLKMGSYDEGIEGYQKRSKDTEAPFIDANPEIIAKAISTIEKVVNKENLDDNELEKLSNSGNFSKIYTIFEKRYKDNIIEYSGTDGIWKKYNQGSVEDAKKLCESLQGKNTHWCTADESTAIKQVCGPYDTKNGGDFYVYYTKDKEEKNTLPRIAMRMKDHDYIGEIRGIEEGQNMEEEMIPILEKKLNRMDFLDSKDRKIILQQIKELKELTNIYKKTIQNEKLTNKELKDLYTIQFGFGWTQDPRVLKTIYKRNVIEDFNKSNDYQTKKTILSGINNKEFFKDSKVDSSMLDKINIDDKFLDEFIEKEDAYYVIKYVKRDDKEKFTEIVNKMIEKHPNAISYIKPNEVFDYDKIATIAVDEDPESIYFVEPKGVSDYESLAIKAVAIYPKVIMDMEPIEGVNYGKIAKTAVERDPSTIRYVSSNSVDNYDEIARIAATNGVINGIESTNVSNYDEIVEIALKKNPTGLQYVTPKKVKNYQRLATIAVKKCHNYIAFKYVDPDYVSNYDELVQIAISRDPNAYCFISKSHVKDADKLQEEYLELIDRRIKENMQKSISYNKRLGFIDIFSITMLLFALGIMMISIIKILH